MIQPDRDHPLTGSCQCRTIRSAVTAPPERYQHPDDETPAGWAPRR